jgi:alanyl-tRNA synthetase
LRTFDAEIVDKTCSGQRVYLDRTAFYPTSGGQPNDLGTLAGRSVVDVEDEGERIAHVLAEPVGETKTLSLTRVRGEIDWPRRYDHMQQHTGQHLLSAIFADLFGFETVSFHLGKEVSTIELAIPDVTAEQIARAEDTANEIIRSARPVSIHFEDAGLAKSLRKASARQGTLRIIEIDGTDRSACGGTHVRSTAELAPLQVRGTERIRGNTRVEFLCGIRAVERARFDYRILADLVRQASLPVSEIPGHVGSLRERLAEAEKRARTLALELARREGAQLYAGAAASNDGIRRLRLQVSRIDEEARARAQAFAAQPKAVALLLAEDGSLLIACSPDSGAHAGNCLKEVAAAAGGKGGGSAALAQGRLANQAAIAMLSGKLGF